MEDAELTHGSTESGETVTYIGDPNDDFSGPSRTTAFGYAFEKNTPVVVEDANALRKLRGHNHFLVGEQSKPEPVLRKDDGLAKMKLDELKELAAQEGAEVDDDATKAKLITAIRRHRGQND